MNNIMTPPAYRVGVSKKDPLIFLAGPIQGAPDWQSEAFTLLRKETDVNIASPRRLGEWEELDKDQSRVQVKWEYAHLERAEIKGVILFWLAKEIESIPGRAYAQTTRIELGKMITLNSILGASVVVGIEPGFSGERYIRFLIEKDAPSISIFDNLSDTCNRTAQLVR